MDAETAKFLGIEADEKTTSFANSGFMIPAKAKEMLREMALVVAAAEKQGRYVRLWCDQGKQENGKMVKKPFFQVSVDSEDAKKRYELLQAFKNSKKSPGAASAETVARYYEEAEAEADPLDDLFD